ncbi:MAG: hypothetical protein WCW44_03260 [archaeon]|jgi:hypothetical protein
MPVKFNGLRAQKNREKKRSVIVTTLKELKLTEAHADALVGRGPAQKVAQRLRVLASLGQTEGLVYKISLTDADFRKLVKRFSENKGLNEGQQKMFDFLIGRSIDRKLAMKLATNSNYARMDLMGKVSFFESFKLDPAIYGVASIPVKSYEQLLWQPLKVLQEGIKKNVLWPLEDKHAAKVLDEKLPNWRKVRVFFPKKGRPLRPAFILRKLRALIEAGIEPRTDRIVRAVSTAKEMDNSKLRFRSKVFKGSGLEFSRKAKNTPVTKLESTISRINARVNELMAGRTKATSSERIFIDEELKELKTRRSLLVKERDSLLYQGTKPN